MPRIDVAALGAARRLLGFSQREVEFTGGTVGDLLRKLPTKDERNLYENLVCDGKLRGDFAVLVNGLSLKSHQLDKSLEDGDEVVTMEIIRHLAGG